MTRRRCVGGGEVDDKEGVVFGVGCVIKHMGVMCDV